MAVGLTFTCTISVYYGKSYELEPRLWRGVLNTIQAWH
jgi:hypothetical protein